MILEVYARVLLVDFMPQCQRKMFFLEKIFLLFSLKRSRKVQASFQNSQRLVACSKMYQNSLKLFGYLQDTRKMPQESCRDVSKSTFRRP